jgi:hypothetical protein
MTMDDLVKNVATEPPQTVVLRMTVLAPGRLEEPRRQEAVVIPS